MDSRLNRRTEVRLFIVLVPLINGFNYYLTYNDIGLNSRTLITFGIDTATGYASWLAVHFIIVWLDRKLPYEGNVSKRLTIQLTTTILAALTIIIGSTILINYMASDRPVPMSFFTTDIFIISVWFLVANGIYIGLHFYREWRAAESKRLEENKIRKEGFPVKTGKQELLLHFAEIGGFGVGDEYVSCHTLKNKQYLIDQSIDRLEKVLPSSLFFRINRQFLIHRQLITGFERAENGKLNVQIRPLGPFPTLLTVSRTKAGDFKNWFRSE